MSGELGSVELNLEELNSFGYEGYGVADSNVILTLKQTVSFAGQETTILTLKQNVVFKSTSSTNDVLTIKQQISFKADDTTLLTLKQQVLAVIDPFEPHTFFQDNDFDVSVSIGNLLITTSNEERNYGLCGQMSATSGEGLARGCKFTIIPPEGPIDFDMYQGKPVIVYQTHFDGNSYRAFTGWVESVSIDFIGRRITLDCSDRRKDRILSVPVSTIQNVGSYSDALFGTSTDLSAELEARLQTVPSCFDFDAYGNHKFVAWRPKTTPDFTFSGEPVYYRNPLLSFTNVDKIVNTVNITVNYTYTRLHHQVASFNWPGFDDWLEDWFLDGKPSFPSKDMIASAADQGNWKRVSRQFQFVDLWPAESRLYNNQVISWQPNEVRRTYKEKKAFAGYLQKDGVFLLDSDGFKIPIYRSVLDTQGKVIMIPDTELIMDTSANLCRGVGWKSALRFTQNVKEQFTIRMQAPQSIVKHGRIEQTQDLTIDDPYDSKNWEGSQQIHFYDENFYIDKKQNLAALNQAMQVSLNKGRVDILRAHRDVEVNFRLKKLWPQIDLEHTVLIDITDPVPSTGDNQMQVKGKVSSVVHTINFDKEEAYTEITIKGSRSSGSASDDLWAVQVPIQDPSYIGDPKEIVLGTHLGLDPVASPNADKWTGFIGNKEKTTVGGGNTTTLRTQYTEQFIVDFPAIPDYIRQDITYNSDNEFDMSIPNDTKNVGF